MSSVKKTTLRIVSEELEKVKVDVNEIHSLRKEVNELKVEIKEAKEEIRKLKKEHNIEEGSLCDLCEIRFPSKGLLKQHKREIHGEDLECKYCDEKFKQVWMLEVHLKEHTEAEIFECDICKKIFQLKWRLSKHKL